MKKPWNLLAAVPLLFALVYAQLAYDISFEFCHHGKCSTHCGQSPGDPVRHPAAFSPVAILPAACTFDLPLPANDVVPHALNLRFVQSSLVRVNPGRAPPVCLPLVTA